MLDAVDLMSSPGDELRAQRLRRMKLVALSFLLGAAILYVATLRLPHTGVWGYVNAMAEAGMVGGLADWFAVTALFRHPLGVPIPHTALIPRKKDELAGSIQTFFTDNFLTEDIVRERVAEAGLSRRAGAWLARPENAERLVAEGVRWGRALLQRVSDDDVRTLAGEVILPRLEREPVSSATGVLLHEVVKDQAHRGLVDLLARELHAWLTQNPQRFTAMLHDRAPSWAPTFVNQRIVSALYWQAVDWVTAVRDNPRHPTRIALDDLILRIAADLQTDEPTQAKLESLKNRLLAHPQVTETLVSLWGSLRTSLSAALDDGDSVLHARAVSAVRQLGGSLLEDAGLQARVDTAATDGVAFLVGTYGDELSSVISHTIQRWDGRDAAQRIELYVGRDLQYIRINGTVVGALAGLAIHALSQLA